MEVTKELIQKVETGKPLTDGELDIAIKHYANIENIMWMHKKEYHLVAYDLTRILYSLNGFKNARKNK